MPTRARTETNRASSGPTTRVAVRGIRELLHRA
jgi:hypothetical protein